ncbi:MAG: PD-(D/E)XK nuclease family protein [Crenarchaeota archaeon]|nr:PD-(D/E)XK nuclease family protein [Thermoproteota archaeon]MDC4215410.1 PD-(D/E)XK nuclease family protein [Candidatus Nitrosopumilus limneticus]HJJ21045.1 PD-(D/E)XK nuclease family protein [Nitrosopumilus sp.]MDA0853938.1 PD-(D/E)XK nuclease family protein [Thermoproteota archaeon]MDA1123278.1 PD-(D/E)XK nuclease family protein [Thermoproteota archaeon]
MSYYNHIPINFRQAVLIKKDNAHFYQTPTGETYPSITTILQETISREKKENLQNWKEQERAANYITEEAAIIGTETHKLIENHINEVRQTDEVRLLSVAHFNNLIPFLQKINDVYGTELRMYSHVMKLAGTSDCIANYDGELSIIDYKTKRSNQKEEWITDYFIQGTAYAQMFKELTGIEPKQVVILVSSEKNSRMEFVKNTEDYKDLLTQRLNQYYDVLE